MISCALTFHTRRFNTSSERDLLQHGPRIWPLLPTVTTSTSHQTTTSLTLSFCCLYFGAATTHGLHSTHRTFPLLPSSDLPRPDCPVLLRLSSHAGLLLFPSNHQFHVPLGPVCLLYPLLENAPFSRTVTWLPLITHISV